MSGNRIFVDTNILLYFLKGEQEIVEMLSGKQIVISFITELELLSFSKLSSNSEKNIKGLLSCCTIIESNEDIKRNTIGLRKEFKLKLPDAIIAATALQLNLPVITADKGFGKLESLEVVLYEL